MNIVNHHFRTMRARRCNPHADWGDYGFRAQFGRDWMIMFCSGMIGLCAGLGLAELFHVLIP